MLCIKSRKTSKSLVATKNNEKYSERPQSDHFFFDIANILSLKNKKNDKYGPTVKFPWPMSFGPPRKFKLGHMKGSVLVLIVARIAKSLRKFLALLRTWNH